MKRVAVALILMACPLPAVADEPAQNTMAIRIRGALGECSLQQMAAADRLERLQGQLEVEKKRADEAEAKLQASGAPTGSP